MSPEHTYVVRGRMDGAVYVSITVECDTEDGSMASRTAGVINDTQFDVDRDGRFEIRLGGARRRATGSRSSPRATRITTRHYYENEVVGGGRPDAQRRARDRAARSGTAAAAARATRRSRAPSAAWRASCGAARSSSRRWRSRRRRPFVSLVPNQFPEAGAARQTFGLAAFDATYSMAPYVIGPDDALVMTGRWPRCRCANVSLWNRFMQTLDYANRPVSRNRAQTTLEPDGSFRIVLAHRDPGHPNWIDTEGRPFGLVFWRFMLAEGEVETPRAEVVKLDQIAAR